MSKLSSTTISKPNIIQLDTEWFIVVDQIVSFEQKKPGIVTIHLSDGQVIERPLGAEPWGKYRDNKLVPLFEQVAKDIVF